MTQQPRPKWGSSLGFVLAAAGSAIGLGNIWKFPFITGMNGGGSFVLLYFLSIVTVGIPILLAELYIGKMGQANPVRCFDKLKGHKTLWNFTGGLGILAAFVILSYYCVLGGWILDFEYRALFNEFHNLSDLEIKEQLSKLLQDPARQVFFHALFLGSTMMIILGGVKSGIEKCNQFFMPGLVLLLFGLLIYTCFLPGFEKAVSFMFYPDFSKVTYHAVLEAVGHAFFTLSVGSGVMLTYGSYLAKNEGTNRLLVTSFQVAVADTIFAVVAGVMIFSVVFSYGLAVDSGPALIFQTLPILFNKMPGGYWVAVAFFMLVFFAAITSAFSLLEVVVCYVSETFHMSRKKTTLLVTLAVFILGLASDLSPNILADVRIFNLHVFEFLDQLASKIMLPTSGLLLALFFSFVLGKKAVALLFADPTWHFYRGTFGFCIRFLAPLFIGILLLMGLGEF